MSDTPLPNGSAGPNAAGGGDGAAAPPSAAIHDESSAMEALHGLLSEDSGQTPPPPAEEGDEPPAEAGGDDEAPVEAPAEAEAPPPGFDPPASWSAEDAAVFKSLPPDAQAILARRESERDRDYHSKTQEIAAERQAIGQAQDTYARSLEQLVALAVPELEQFRNLDWQRLSVEQPTEYVRLYAYRDALRQRLDTLSGEHARVSQQRQALEARQRADIIAQQKEVLIQRVPEFRDPAKAQQLTRDLTTGLSQHYGISPEEVASLIDARQVAVALDAVKWRQHVSARAAAEAKQKAAPAPTMQSAGTPAQADNRGRRMQNKMSALRESGSVRDAASLIKELL